MSRKLKGQKQKKHKLYIVYILFLLSISYLYVVSLTLTVESFESFIRSKHKTTRSEKTLFNITPNIQKQHVLRERVRRTIVFLRLDEGFDKRVRRLRVERESVSQRLQLWTLLQERVFQSVASRMEVLFDRIQGSF